MAAGGPGSRWRARILRTTSAEWTPWGIVWAQAAATAGGPSVCTGVGIPTSCRLPSPAPGSFGRSASNTSQIVCSVSSGWRCTLAGDAFIEQPGVQLVQGLEPQTRREEPLTHEPDLVLDLPLLPARCRRARDRIDEVVTAHLQEAAIVQALLADEDRRHRGLHVVVDATAASALEPP